MKQIKHFLYVVLVVVFVQSCTKIEEGTVLSKRYEPENSYMQMMPITNYNGKTTTITYYWYYIHDDEDFVLTVKGYSKGKEIIKEVYVSKECYNSLNSGDYWKITDSCSFSDQNNTKERK